MSSEVSIYKAVHYLHMEGSDDETKGSSSADADPLPSSLDIALTNWAVIGQGLLNDVLFEMSKNQLVKDEMMKTLIFSVVGGYTFHFSKSWKTDNDYQLAHSQAITKLMSQPQITSMIEGFMQNKVSSKVEEMV